MDIVAFKTWMNLLGSSLLNGYTILTTFLLYGPSIAVSLHNGPNLNYAFIKEAVKHKRRALEHNHEHDEEQRKIERLKRRMDIVGIRITFDATRGPQSVEEGVLIQ
jgi:hypothetical protein